jgi:Holliday junction DNA helicase RuvA
MIDYIKGELTTMTPTFGVIEAAGIGYVFNCTINSFENLSGKKQAKVFMHTTIREDAHTLFGFANEGERAMFRSLISVSGIGPSSSIAALSSYKPAELQDAIMQGDVGSLKKIKGIGAKSAERIIVDLRDKIGDADSDLENFSKQSNTMRSEALRALRNLGFDQRKAQKAVDKVLGSSDESLSIEDLIKQSLKGL